VSGPPADAMGVPAGITDANLHAIFNISKKGNDLAVTIGHEGVHLNDYVLGNMGFTITQQETEGLAWTVSSYLAQGLGMNHYPSGATDALEKYQVWNKGWKAGCPRRRFYVWGF
jgi:hypothetical protein